MYINQICSWVYVCLCSGWCLSVCFRWLLHCNTNTHMHTPPALLFLALPECVNGKLHIMFNIINNPWVHSTQFWGWGWEVSCLNMILRGSWYINCMFIFAPFIIFKEVSVFSVPMVNFLQITILQYYNIFYSDYNWNLTNLHVFNLCHIHNYPQIIFNYRQLIQSHPFDKRSDFTSNKMIRATRSRHTRCSINYIKTIKTNLFITIVCQTKYRQRITSIDWTSAVFFSFLGGEHE